MWTMTEARVAVACCMLAVAIALTGCMSSNVKGSAVGAGKVQLEPTLDPNTKRPILLPVPTPDLSKDTAGAINELARRPGRDSLRETSPDRPSLPGLGHD